VSVIRSELTGGERVVAGAEFIEVAIDLQRVAATAALEHHVLKKMRNAHKLYGLVACASLYEKSDRSRVRERINFRLNLKAVGQSRATMNDGARVHRAAIVTSKAMLYTHRFMSHSHAKPEILPTETALGAPSPAPSSAPSDAPSHAPSAHAVARTVARHPRPLGGDTQRTTGASLLDLTAQVINNRDAAAHHLKVQRKPDWLRARVPGGEGYERLKGIIDEHRLHTVCQEASCPNMGECWSRGTATIMILGDTCTRACGFCNVKTGKPATLDLDEPRRVAASLALMKLKHVVITSVNRDELADGGAEIWAETIRRVHESCPQMSVEVLVGDFQGDERAIATVCDARPEIIAHNMETVRRMHGVVRPQAKYQRSLAVLQQFKASGLVTKTGIMVGIGEHDDEVLELLSDVRAASDADIITIGQYLQPTRNHLPINRWVHPDQFAMFRREALTRGFKVCESGPLVRSSYHAEEQAAMLSTAAQETRDGMSALIEQGREARA
jgi:lipoyl synthase